MKKLNLTDKRNLDYFYSEAIKTLRTNIQLSVWWYVLLVPSPS